MGAIENIDRFSASLQNAQIASSAESYLKEKFPKNIAELIEKSTFDIKVADLSSSKIHIISNIGMKEILHLVMRLVFP
jgi:hypothetical protein